MDEEAQSASDPEGSTPSTLYYVFCSRSENPNQSAERARIWTLVKAFDGVNIHSSSTITPNGLVLWVEDDPTTISQVWASLPDGWVMEEKLQNSAAQSPSHRPG